MKHLLISAGPIPAKLDSVKLITNKFKGGLALLTASKLSEEFKVTVVAHEGTDAQSLPPEVEVLRIRDVMEYHNVIRDTEADIYVLAGAVANLMPVKPWEGKFPSHNYKEGDVFDIPFTLAPRIIDRVRKWHPKATLIGYKLFDGTDEELIAAGRETLQHSKAHLVFCNHPKWAKKRKIALTPDGAVIPMTFDTHIEWIKKVSQLEWYQTKETWEEPTNPHTAWMETLLRKITVPIGEYRFGTIAIRHGEGFWTTARGKTSNSEFAYVRHVDHIKKTVFATKKATLNAPTLARIFELNPEAQVILHGHQECDPPLKFKYLFPGTTEEVAKAQGEAFAVEHHGYYYPFKSFTAANNWLITGIYPEPL